MRKAITTLCLVLLAGCRQPEQKRIKACMEACGDKGMSMYSIQDGCICHSQPCVPK